MDKNFGDVIKKLAVVIGFFGSIGSFIWGLSTLTQSNRIYYDSYNETTSSLGIAIILCGVFLSVVFAMLVYGFGELIESVQRIEFKFYKPVLDNKTPNLYQNVLKKKASVSQNDDKKPEYVNCIKCGKLVNKEVEICPHCGIKRVVRKH